MGPEQRNAAAEWDVPPSQAIIEAVADAEGVDLFDVSFPAYEPLYSVIDPEALDSLFDGTTDDLRVELTYAGYDVTVFDGGRVRLTRRTEPPSEVLLRE